MDASIYVLHENGAWLKPLAAALERRRLPWREWFLDVGSFDLAATPPEGIFFSRMSASAHTRDHRFSPELAGAVLAWLARHGRRVINGAPVLDLEISKVRQYAALEAAGLTTPHTVFVAGRDRLVEAARRHFPEGPFILKPNRGGKGLGVQLVQDPDTLAAQLERSDWEAPVDGIYLLQAYIRSPQQLITRAEFIGGRFVYAVEVDTRDGFELCPADVCAVGEAFCPADGATAAERPKFHIVDGIEPRLVERYEAFLAANGIEVAGIEFIRDGAGVYTYDVNTNSNYNPDAEQRAGRSAMDVVARFLGDTFERHYPAREAAA